MGRIDAREMEVTAIKIMVIITTIFTIILGIFVVKQISDSRKAVRLANKADTVVEDSQIPYDIPCTDEEVDIMAVILHNEASVGCVSEVERSMVVWCMLNRYDVQFLKDTTMKDICTHKSQFAYKANTYPRTEDRNLVIDVIERWSKEKAGQKAVGRTLPKQFLYFVQDSDPSTNSWHNAFYTYDHVYYGDKIWYDYANPAENPYAYEAD